MAKGLTADAMHRRCISVPMDGLLLPFVEASETGVSLAGDSRDAAAAPGPGDEAAAATGAAAAAVDGSEAHAEDATRPGVYTKPTRERGTSHQTRA